MPLEPRAGPTGVLRIAWPAEPEVLCAKLRAGGLLRFCESELEREFLHWLYQRGLRLPDRAQVPFGEPAVRPDFVFDNLAWVYVDGPPHRFPERERRDAAADTALENPGWIVIRVQGSDTWETKVRELPWVFGAWPLLPTFR